MEDISASEYIYGSHIERTTEVYPVLMFVIYKQNQETLPLVIGFTTNLSKFMEEFFRLRPTTFKDIVMEGDRCTFTHIKDKNRSCMYTSPIHEGQCVLLRFGETAEQRRRNTKITN